MTIPIGHKDLKPETDSKIEFKRVKDRKEFIKDVATLRIALALIDVSLSCDTFDGEIKALHKNKNRKQIKEANEYLTAFKEVMRNIHSQSTTKDISTTIYISEKLFKDMVKISYRYTNVSLVHVSMHLVYKRFNREKNFENLRLFIRKWGLARVVKVFEDAGIESNGQESKMAEELCEIIKGLYK